jgi:hypothetical protein
MDKTLLQRTATEPQARVGPGVHEPHNNSNDRIEKGEVERAIEHTEEFRELQLAAAQAPLRMTIEPPLEYDGEKFKVLIFDFDSMIGKDFIRAEREFNRLYKPDKDEMVLPEMKHLYHQIIAAHRANVPLGVIQKLPRRYYTPLRVEVLKACGSSPEEEKA